MNIQLNQQSAGQMAGFKNLDWIDADEGISKKGWGQPISQYKNASQEHR